MAASDEARPLFADAGCVGVREEEEAAGRGRCGSRGDLEGFLMCRGWVGVAIGTAGGERRESRGPEGAWAEHDRRQ